MTPDTPLGLDCRIWEVRRCLSTGVSAIGTTSRKSGRMIIGSSRANKIHAVLNREMQSCDKVPGEGDSRAYFGEGAGLLVCEDCDTRRNGPMTGQRPLRQRLRTSRVMRLLASSRSGWLCCFLNNGTGLILELLHNSYMVP